MTIAGSALGKPAGFNLREDRVEASTPSRTPELPDFQFCH